MFFGRFLGWTLLGIALLMASGDVVLALGPGEHVGIVTRDVWLLVAGRYPDTLSAIPSLTNIMMAWPAWVVIAPAGTLLLWACRHRRRRIRATRFG
jgi:hypothetical protein